MWADLAVAGALFIVVTLILTEMTLVVMALVPPDDLSDSVLRTMVIINTYFIWGAGAFAVALFVGATSMAIRQARPASRWLGWSGLANAAASVVGVAWLIDGSADGPLFALEMLSRMMFLVWVVAAGVWLYRTAEPDDEAIPVGGRVEPLGT
jgi:hypothetical protein